MSSLSNRTTNGSLRGSTSLSPYSQNGVSYFSNLGQAIAETELRKTRPRPIHFPRVAGSKALVRGAARLGLTALQYHPAMRAANMAFKVANALDFSNPWAHQPKGSQGTFDGWDLSEHGYYTSCENPSVPWITNPCQQCAVAQWDAIPGGICNASYAHVGSPHALDQPIRITYENSSGQIRTRRAITMGPIGGFACSPNPAARYAMRVKWAKNVTTVPAHIDVPARWIGQVAGHVFPVDDGVPAPATITESWVEPTLPAVDVAPYGQPAISADGNGPPVDSIHILRPPGPDEKEKKKKMSARQALALMGALYDAATEANDIIGVLYDAMDKKRPYKPGVPCNMSCKANWIFNNLEHLDIGKAVGGLIKNHLEDKYIYGKIYGTIGSHTGYGSMGPSHGGWSADIGTPTAL